MQVNYCDLCNQPLKDDDYFMFYISEAKSAKSTNLAEYCDCIDKVKKEFREVCPTCKHIFDKMFELRLLRLSELTEEINLNYNLPSKKKSNEKKQK
jgi:hypothetical protein